MRYYSDLILKFNPDNGSWSQVGQLKQARAFHGASLVNPDDIINFCS